MRQTGDEFADATVREVFEKYSFGETEDEIYKIVKHPVFDMKKFPPPIQKYFERLDESVFTEEDTRAFDRSVEIFNEHGFRILLLLFFKSLPSGYMAPKPGHVLATTQLLVNQATRRVFETAIYILSVMKKDWYKDEKEGVRMLEKLRFLHSSMRVQIQDYREWDQADMGVPINQADQVLTLQLFSLAVIRGLHEMGISLSKEDREAWFHTWRRIGRILGIKEELEPDNIEDGWALQNKIMERQFIMPNKDGRALTNALLTVMLNLSKENVSMASLEKITRYFLFGTSGVTLTQIQESLGMESKATWKEYVMNHVVYYLVNFDLWHKIFHRKPGASPITKFARKALASSLGLSHRLDTTDETAEVLDVLVKEMLSNLISPAATANAIHSRKFEIDDGLIKSWGLAEWDSGDIQGGYRGEL